MIIYDMDRCGIASIYGEFILQMYNIDMDDFYGVFMEPQESGSFDEQLMPSHPS